MTQDTAVRGYLVRNTLCIFVGLLINQVIQTLGSGVAAHLIPSRNLFGQLNLLLQILGMSGMFITVGLDAATTYWVAKHGGKAISVVYPLAVFVSFLESIMVFIAIVFSSHFLSLVYHAPNLFISLLIAGATFLFNSVLNVAIAALSGMRRFILQALFMVMATVSSTGALILGVLSGNGRSPTLMDTSIWMVIGAAIVMGSALLAVYRCYPVSFFLSMRWDLLRKMLRYGIPMWAANILKACQQPLLVMLAGGTSVVAVDYLNNGLMIVGFLNIVTWAFNVVSLPFLSGVIHDEQQATWRATLSFRYNNFLLFPLTAFVCLFPNQITDVIFGARYVTHDTPRYVVLLALGILFSSVGRMGGTLLAGIGKTRANFWSMAISGIIVYLTAPFFVLRNPMYAPMIYMIGWAVSIGPLFWFMFHDGLPIDLWKSFGEPLVPTLVGIAILELVLHFWVHPAITVSLCCILLITLTALIERRDMKLSH